MLTEDLGRALRRMGLLSDQDGAIITAMGGGVSSDIHLCEVEGRRFCVKQALPRLKVAARWEAPVGRNAAEAAWLRAVGRWLPRAVPAVLGEDPAAGIFAMSYLPPDHYPVWKGELLDGRIDADFAGAVGRDLAEIHRRSAGDPAIRERFANDPTFEAIRIEPYLRATGRAHPDLAQRFEDLAAVTSGNKKALMHGDVSPKNILHGPDGPVFIDAECACYGDPAFDLAFCLNHLLLKGARMGPDRPAYLEAFTALARRYAEGVTWEDWDGLEARASALLPALFLARVDGKSPVEYLAREDERDAVRRHAVPLIAEPVRRLDAIAAAWAGAR